VAQVVWTPCQGRDHLGGCQGEVAYWRKRPDIVPQPAIQEALDAALERAPERAKAQFALLLGADKDYPPSAGNQNGLTPDDQDRLNGVIRRPSRLDAATVENLSQVLTGQRRAEDALGPEAILAPMALQLSTIREVLRDASGPHREALARLVAEWTSFVGWLHTAVRKDSDALALFADAEDLADDVGDGTIAATAASFRGYLARLQDRPRSAIRASAAALATPGAHPTQHTFDILQTAQAYADLGDKKEAQRFLAKASDLATTAGEPPDSVYWYTEPFFRLNIGLAQLGIGQYREAADSLRSGIEDIPADQRDAEWMNKYRQALAYASERA
jgi:tetratricopeptide (TPR) repeat protein